MIEIKPLSSSPVIREMLIIMLIETVAHGGSVSFMHPLSREDAEAFWSNSLAAADRGERIILGAFDGDDLIATVTLLLDLPPNQPHRAEIAKMMTRPSYRGRGVASGSPNAITHSPSSRTILSAAISGKGEAHPRTVHKKKGARLESAGPSRQLRCAAIRIRRRQVRWR